MHNHMMYITEERNNYIFSKSMFLEEILVKFYIIKIFIFNSWKWNMALWNYNSKILLCEVGKDKISISKMTKC